MTAVFRLIFLAALLAQGPYVGALAADDSEPRTIEQYTCKDIMREHGADRDVAIAFLHGFVLGKSGRTSFRLEVLHKETADFIEHCLDNPSEKAVDVMLKVKG